jgi:bile acid:Na+ symporter, BASS family
MELVIVTAGKISLAVAVFAIGLTTTPADVSYMLRAQGKLLRALLVMFVVIPAVVVALALTFRLTPAVEIALAALSVSPTPALLSKKALRASGQANYAVSLLVAASLVAIAWVPLSLEVLERIFAIPLQMRALPIGGIVMASVLAPLGAGVLVRTVAPQFARSAAGPCAALAGIVLLLSVVAVLFVMLRPILSLIGNGTLAAIAGFAVVGLAVGHLLGGPGLETRKVLALYAISRHPGIAMAIIQANFPGQPVILAAILLAVVVTTLVPLPYLLWAKPHETTPAIAE